MIGSQIGHYRIERLLGSGGMGEVYLAHDSKLGRQVALKWLLPEVAADVERRNRFEREARAVAALNHPNIVTLYSIESAGDVHYVTMEFVSGQTLSKLIPATGLPLGRFFDIALPLTDAVSVAHEHGVTHRDLKPDNVMVTDRGQVKVLDFGLAKLRPRPFDSAKTTTALSEARTMRGQVLGTLAYMSPEQAEGREVDHRTDIFSLGILMHEMLTGQRPFTGESAASLLSALLRDTPRLVSEVRREVPARLARIIQRCLEKDPARRYQSVADLRADIAEIRQEVDSGFAALAATPPRPRRRAYLAAGLILVIAAAAAGAYWLQSRRAPGAEALGDLAFLQVTHAPGQELFPSLSPDGRTIVYAGSAAGNFDIYSQRVGGENPVNLTPGSPVDDTQPALSRDGERIAFRSERDGGGIFIMGATGESIRRATTFGYHPAWSPDEQQLAVVTQSVTDPSLRFTTSELWVVNLATEQRRKVTDADAAQPSWSPSGQRIAYWGRSGASSAGDIFTIPAAGGAPVAVTTDPALDWNPVWAPDGAYLYFSSNRGGSMNLWRVAMDEATGRPLGRPQPVTTGGGPAAQHVAISADGRRIAYVARANSMNLQRVGFDPAAGVVTGTAEGITTGSRAWAQPHPSPDGSRLAFNSSGRQENIFVLNADGTGLQQLTDTAHIHRSARWSPDGQRIAFYSDRTGAYEIWSIGRDGSGLQQLTRSQGAHYPVWSPDGERMVYSTHVPGNFAYIFDVGRPWDQQTPVALPVIPDPALSFEVWDWSPDGRWLAGQKHLRDLSHAGIAIHEVGTDRLDWLTDFGEWPVWLNDSRRLLFSHLGKLYLIDRLTRDPREVLSTPQQTLGSVGLSRDQRTLYYTIAQVESDLWLITLK
jgi:eukaryotic-like serine/threonine-protein kinase